MRVLFVSKAIAAPWNDGSKNLVRDLARHMRAAEVSVMTSRATRRGESSAGPATRYGEEARSADGYAQVPVYSGPGSFAPGWQDNARAFAYVALRGTRYDVLHFVFAPNPKSSTMCRGLVRWLRARGWRGSVVQTVASQPKDFRGASDLLFGDRVVVVSSWTKTLLAANAPRVALDVIAPCVAAPEVSPDRVEKVRREFDLGTSPCVLYPGDYEVSSGAETFIRAIERAAASLPNHRFVLACRTKTARAREKQTAILHALAAPLASRVRVLGDVSDMLALVAAAEQVAFPVDDLYGKVDVPLVLLEACALGKPMVVCDGGPLVEIACAQVVRPRDETGLAAAIERLAHDAKARTELGREGRALHAARYSPAAASAAYETLYAQLQSERP